MLRSFGWHDVAGLDCLSLHVAHTYLQLNSNNWYGSKITASHILSIRFTLFPLITVNTYLSGFTFLHNLNFDVKAEKLISTNNIHVLLLNSNILNYFEKCNEANAKLIEAYIWHTPCLLYGNVFNCILLRPFTRVPKVIRKTFQINLQSSCSTFSRIQGTVSEINNISHFTPA